jgi:Rieske Fe-S protein
MSHEFEGENLPAPERRSFLGIIAGLITTGIGAVVGVTIGRFAILPAFSQTSEIDWKDLGPVSDLEEGKLIKKSVTVAQDAGWGKFEAQRSVWVVRKGESVKVFSGVCPHLGCSVNAQEEKFVCACHGSYWDPDGNTTEGPTPRGLDTLEHRVEDDKLKIRYQYFKQGVTEKEVLG